MSSVPPSGVADAIASPTSFDRYILAAEDWFEKSPYASYLPYALGALAMLIRFYIMRKEMRKASQRNTRRPLGGSPAPSATATSPETSSTASSTEKMGGKGSVTKRKGK